MDSSRTTIEEILWDSDLNSTDLMRITSLINQFGHEEYEHGIEFAKNYYGIPSDS